jgi:hypothetical protein
MSFATINESDKTLTNNLSSKNEKDDNKSKFTEAIDMEKYNETVINEQIEKSNINRQQIEEDAKKRVEDYNKKAEELKMRALQYDKEQNKGWAEFKNHWFWKHYFSNANKTTYTEQDNINDSLNDKNYQSVEISKDFQPIGESYTFDEPAPYVENHQYYITNDGSKYMYNYPHNLMFPVDKNININSPEFIKQQLQISVDGQHNDKKTLDLALKLKEKLNQKNQENQEQNTKTESKEHFESLDPKLVQIYQKTLPPGETPPPPKEERNILFNYIYCIIFVIFVYLVFRST